MMYIVMIVMMLIIYDDDGVDEDDDDDAITLFTIAAVATIAQALPTVLNCATSSKTIMLCRLLDSLRYDDPDLLELIHFLRSALQRNELSRRKWLKPAARYDKLWKWCVWIISWGRFRSQFIVTRTAIILRVHNE
jgi:hypothetical protein